MRRAIIWDLEGVLTSGLNSDEIVINPEAHTLLERSRADFQRVYLWTLANIRKVLPVMDNLRLLRYFDRVIGQDRRDPNVPDVVLDIVNGAYSGRHVHLPASQYKKDLRLINRNLSNCVLIEDEMVITEDELKLLKDFFGEDWVKRALPDGRIMRNGFPPERIVYIRSFEGQEGNCLHEAYERALSLCDGGFRKNIN